ncbi:MAG: hypothetical protein AAFX51_14625, partial [Cyanobacteria bacterium J06636_28]
MVQRLLWCVVALWAAVLWTSNPVSAEVTLNSQPSMVIEWLKFRVDPAERSRYLEIDEAIWTAALKTYPGFQARWFCLESQ